ncbi:MAG: peptide-methionine (S)-S-oxide reductase, partial [Anaerolineae bacterium]|nr:peptide-methionine (S)-S-oxide reductase [Anaerolineae bacterium]
FFKAEDYHQNYYNQNKSAPYCELIIEPKIEKVRERFADLLKDQAK